MLEFEKKEHNSLKIRIYTYKKVLKIRVNTY